MKFLLLFFGLTVANTLFATEFTPTEVVSYLNKPYQQVKAFITKKGYAFSKKDEDWYIFNKFKGGNKYLLTLIVKNGKVTTVSTKELYSDYPTILQNITDEGFEFNQGGHVAYPSGEQTEFDEAPSKAIASSLIRFDKETKYSCFFVCPYNLKNGTNLFSVNYGNYSK